MREELDRHGYEGWTVTIAGEPFSADRPCVEVSYDGTSNSVLLISSQRG